MKELFEQIEAAPDEAGPYLVYSDYLQAEGDPRGELIALQHAVLLDAENDTAKERVDWLLKQHRKSWLGPLAESKKAEVQLCWKLGFVSGAVVSCQSIERSMIVLRQLLELESARFLQRLSIRVKRFELDYAPVFDLLIAQKRPITLSELRVGEPGRTRVPAEIFEVFPRLQDRPEETWRKIVERIAEQKRLKSGYEGAVLPALELIDPELKEEIAVDSDQLLVGLRAETDRQREIGLLAAMSRLFTAESLDVYCEALLRLWEDEGGRSARRWVLSVVGALGNDRCARLLGRRLDRWSHQRAVQATELLVQIGSPLGINAVYELTAAEGARAKEADTVLVRMASSRGVSRDGVLDRAVPQPLESADKAWFLELQRRWLEELMINGHRLTLADFRHFVVSGPRRRLARRLVWGLFRGQALQSTFAVDSGAIFYDAAGAEVVLDNDGSVGVVHPLELDRKQRRRWFKQLRERRIKQPFLQLCRPIFDLDPDEVGRKTLYRFANRALQDTRQMDSRWKAWESYNIDNDESLYGDELALRRGGNRLEVIAVRKSGYVERVFNRAKRPFGQLDPVLVSEVLFDLEAATTLKMADGFPHVERQPTDEETSCVVCHELIAASTTRIGVQRATPSKEDRKKASTVWVHYGCIGRCPELQLAERYRDIRAEIAKARAALGRRQRSGSIGNGG